MKALLAILFFSLVALNNSLDDQLFCGIQFLPSKRDECTSSKLADGIFKCCYETYYQIFRSFRYSYCRPITEEQYKNISDYINTRKAAISGCITYSLDCSFKYLALSIMPLILLLLL